VVAVAAALCVVLDAGLLGAGNGAVSPEAIAIIGTAVRLDAELALSPLGQRVEVVLEDDGSGAAAAACTVAEREFARVSAARDAEGACGPDSALVVIARAPRELASGAVWVLGDAWNGLADITDSDRRFREVLGVPVPRPLPPNMITGELIRLPAATDRTVLLRAVLEAERTSWAILGGHAVLYSESSDQIDALLTAPGVERLSHAVHLTRLRLVDVVPEGATVLLRLDVMILVEADDDAAEGRPWRKLRFGTSR